MATGSSSTGKLDNDDAEVEKQTELMYKDGTIWTAVFNADRNAINKLIEHNPNVINERGAVGECPIHLLFLCADDKHLAIAQDLILRFPNIITQTYNKPRYYGENILHIAIVKRKAHMVDWLLSHNKLQPYKRTLLTATATGDFFKIGQPSYYGETPLGFACGTNQWDIVEILLKHNADMDATDSNDNTILHMLAIRRSTEMYSKFKARWIEERKKNEISSSLPELWNRLNQDGLTPLTIAADFGRVKMLEWLLNERRRIQWSFGHVTCVIHPLDQLDLSLQNDNEGPLSVLEVMVKRNDPKLVNPILISLIDKKWKHFAYGKLRRRFLVTFLYLLVFLITTMLDKITVEQPYATTAKMRAASKKYSFMTSQILCILGHIIVLTGALVKSTTEVGQMATMGLLNYLNTKGSIFLENLLSSTFCMCIFSIHTLRLFEMHQHEPLILAFASLIGWGYMFFFTMPFRFTGPFVIMIYKMLFTDVLRFCVIYLIFLAGFSQSFFILFNEDGLEGFIASLKHCFLGLLGDFDFDFYTEGRYPIANIVLLMLYILVITILLLNLLIAMMGDTYADVKRSAKKLWHLERARIALDIENEMSTYERQLPCNKYWVQVQGERYLQVEEVTVDHDCLKDDSTDDEQSTYENQ